MISRIRRGLLAATLVSVIASGGCDTNESAFDCAISCEFWQTCIDESLDVDSCVNACAEREATDPDFPSEVAACDTCIVDSVGENCENADACRNDCENVVDAGSQ